MLGRIAPLLGLLTVVALAGCSQSVAGPSFRLSGAFSEDFGPDDRADFLRTVQPYSDDAAFMESFPEQFAVRGIEGGCEELRRQLQEKEYVASVGLCVSEESDGSDPEAPTSDG